MMKAEAAGRGAGERRISIRAGGLTTVSRQQPSSGPGSWATDGAPERQSLSSFHILALTVHPACPQTLPGSASLGRLRSCLSSSTSPLRASARGRCPPHRQQFLTTHPGSVSAYCSEPRARSPELPGLICALAHQGQIILTPPNVCCLISKWGQEYANLRGTLQEVKSACNTVGAQSVLAAITAMCQASDQAPGTHK